MDVVANPLVLSLENEPIKVKIGIIKEGKVPIDKRTPFTPKQAAEIQRRFPEINVSVQSSPIRCFTDSEYLAEGIEVKDSVSDCDVLMGVKEVPLNELIPDKSYFFFSHTIKKQAYNKNLLQQVLEKNIRLIDYETLTDQDGNRVVAFGRWAGIVGAYNGLWTYGKRYGLYDLRRAKDCFDLEDLKTEFSKITLPPIKIVITGGGRVAKGAMEVLDAVGISKVAPKAFLLQTFDQPVYTQLEPGDYNQHVEGKSFQLKHFFQHPEEYKGTFHHFTRNADQLIASAYWDPKAPVLFTMQESQSKDFKIKVIADITCDIEGSIPSTKKASTIDDPIYDYNPKTGQIENALSDPSNITVMAVDNLPCELPRDASNSFGNELLTNVLPSLINDDQGVIKRATITRDGKLTNKYLYLTDFVNGK
ncbi:MAG: NAD(P)-dependent oxidoreductase [Bacteroidota bacterium]